MSGTSTAPVRLVVRVDATPATGLGHAVRVAGIIAQIPLPLHLIVVGAGEALDTMFPDAERHRAADDTAPLAALAQAHNAAGVLVDLPSYDGRAWTGPADAGPRVMVIDDVGGPIAADLILNGTVLDEYHHYPLITDAQRLLVGPRYTMIRKAFGATPWRGSQAAGVVVVAGSGPRAAEWTSLLTDDSVDRSHWGKVTMIVGSTFANTAELRRQCARIGVELSTGLSGEQLAEALAGAAAALITGGMIVYEALAVGVPSVVFPQLPNLPPEATWLAARNCILDLGYDGGMDPAMVATAVSQLLDDPVLAKDMSTRARKLIDGRGTMRAAEAIAALLTAPYAPRTA